MRTWKIGIFAVVLVFAVATIAYALNTSTAADSDSHVSISSVSGQEIQLSSDGCCPKKADKGCPKKSEKGCPKKSEKGCPKEAEKGCPKKASGCDKK